MSGAPAVKICGLTRHEDALVAEAAGAIYGGINLVPGSPRRIDHVAGQAVLQGTDLVRCAIVANETFENLIGIVDVMGLAVLQLHGDETPAFAARLRAATGIQIWKAVRARSGDDFVRALDLFAGSVDGLLVDGWSPKALGGTGVRFPWEEVAEHRHRLQPPLQLIVAGGLVPDNVAEVAALLEPDVVDVSSGVESSPGIKDSQLIHRFVAAVATAGAREGV